MEKELHSLLSDLVGGRCYPDVTPESPEFPCIVYQVVGGNVPTHLERKLPDCEYFRVQVSCWSRRVSEARSLAAQVLEEIVENGKGFKAAAPLGQAIGIYESVLKLHGTRQDFGIWFKVR